MNTRETPGRCATSCESLEDVVFALVDATTRRADERSPLRLLGGESTAGDGVTTRVEDPLMCRR